VPTQTFVWKTIAGWDRHTVNGQYMNLPAGSDLYNPTFCINNVRLFGALEWTNVKNNEVGFRRPWRSCLARGEDATTNVSLDKTSIKLPLSEIGFVFINKPSPPGQTTYWTLIKYNAINAATISPMGDPSTLYNNNVIGYLKRCAEVQRRFNGGVFLGELKETIQMITRPAKAIRRALDGHKLRVTQTLHRNGLLARVRNGTIVDDPTAARRARQIISNGWLQFKFGIQPLVNDLDDGVRATAEYFNHVPRERVSYTSRQKFVTTALSSTTGFYNLSYRIRTTRESSYRITTRGAVKVTGPDQTNPAFIRHFGLSWREAVLAGWEIIPYSFLVDYFTNIGDFLEAAMFPQAELAWTNQSKYTEHKADLTIPFDTLFNNVIAPTAPGFSWVWKGDPSLHLKRRLLDRTRYVVLQPVLALRVPGVGSLKWLNIAALVHSRL
jgi:hypothetical protein